jgi:hypothetical protein
MPGTVPEQLWQVNAQWCNGIAPGFWPTAAAATGLTLNIGTGTVIINGAVSTYAASTLTMTNNTTNYVFLNSAGVPSVNTTGFTSTTLPIAVVVTLGGNITSILDVRTWFNINSSASTGPYVIQSFEGDPTLTAPIGSQKLLRIVIPGTVLNHVTLSAGLPGAFGGCYVAPTAAATVNLLWTPFGSSQSNVGSINIAASAVVSTFTFASTIVLGPGDLLDFVFQATADATLAGLYWTIPGVRS